MDKTIEVVLAAVVVVLIASILIFMVAGESTEFTEFLGDQTDESSCELYEARCNYEAAEDADCPDVDSWRSECNGGNGEESGEDD